MVIATTEKMCEERVFCGRKKRIKILKYFKGEKRDLEWSHSVFKEPFKKYVTLNVSQ
jgi:hypothetical protein